VTRGVIYTRISKDDKLDRLGVLRQRDDLDREAARRDLEVVRHLEDDDLTGGGSKRRPDFEVMLEMIRNGEVSTVMAADLDRLGRGWKDHVRFYDACFEMGITVIWLGGEANFATGAGLLELEMRASFGREELRKIKQRCRRKHQELREKGLDSGGGPVYGYRPGSEGSKDRMEVVYEPEAEIIREATKRVLEGESLRSVVRDFKLRGVRGVRGGLLDSGSLRQILYSARISGRRSDTAGKVVGPGTWAWDGIISIKDSDALRALRSGRKIGRAPGQTTKHPLVGLLFCDLCAGRIVSVGGGQFRCNNSDCGRVKITAAPLGQVVEAALLDFVEGGAIARLLAESDAAGAQEALVELDARDRALATRWAQGKLSDASWDAAREGLEAERLPLMRQVERQRRSLGLSDIPDPLRAAWPDMSHLRRRMVYRTLIRRITIKPFRQPGMRRFHPSRVEIDWVA
jgi:site-specific DNA recombinase